MEQWEEVFKESFGTAAVNKNMAIKNEILGLPRYVSEYLLGAFCDDEVTEESIKNLNKYVKEHRIDPRDKEVFKHQLNMAGNLKIIDKFKVKIDFKKKKTSNNTQTEIPSLEISDAETRNNILKEYDRLLIDGLWGMGELEIDEDKNISLVQFKPFQLSDIEIDEFIKARERFSTEDWINLMISTVGLNYKLYTRRQKLILLSRLIPIVENNVFMMEFGYPGTGKTYVFENISSYSRVISGSKITAPQLFYNLNLKKDGLLVQYDVLLFDEIDKIKQKGMDDDVTNKLYEYLASGKFDRGGVEKTSECGIIMVGNLPKGSFRKEGLLKSLLHETNTKEAFLDRLAGVIPGWELESLKDPKSAYTQNYGFAADYFSEILHKLRRVNLSYELNRINFNNCSIRDNNSIKRIISGLLKLVYPDKNFTYEEYKEIIDLAIEYRQFVIDQNFEINKNPKLDKKIEYELI